MRTPNPQYKILNISDKFGDVLRTRNINFDLQGYAQLSPRMARLYSASNNSHFKLPVALGKQAIGETQILTADSNFISTIATNAVSVAEDTGSEKPSATFDSDGEWFNGLWHVSTATAVLTRPASGGASQAYTPSPITGLTSGVRHIVKQNKSRVQLCVSNGYVVKQYNTSYVNTTDLTIPADYEVVGMAYSGGNMGIITRLANDGTRGNDQEAMFYVWSGATTSAGVAIGLGSDAGMMVLPYKSSFVVVTRSGEVKYFNGAGFQTLATFPFFFTQQTYGDAQSNNALGNLFGYVDGDNIIINIGSDLNVASRDGQRYLKTQPAGVWCYDPNIGLYQRYSLSNSPMYINAVAVGGVDTSTDILTTSGTVPSTGNIARLIDDKGIGGLEEDQDYYVIQLSSTTFRLAETRELAFAGDYIDITSTGSDTSHFLMIEHVDYGTCNYQYPGAISGVGDVGNNYAIYTDILAGATIYDTDGDSLSIASIGVPWMENIGVIETTRYPSLKSEDKERGFDVWFKPLNEESSIEIYSKTHDALGIPFSTPNVHATWSGKRGMYTTADLTKAEEYFANGSLLVEIVSGAGAGNFLQVQSINCSGGTCAVEFFDDVFGVQSGDVCDFIIDNYKYEYTITSDDNDDGYVSVATDLPASKFAQFLIVPKGYDVIIEQFDYKSVTHK